jgi:hypothetical protein
LKKSAGHVLVAQNATSSSEPSGQALTPSHVISKGMQEPVEHSNSVEVQLTTLSAHLFKSGSSPLLGKHEQTTEPLIEMTQVSEQPAFDLRHGLTVQSSASSATATIPMGRGMFLLSITTSDPVILSAR